MTKHLNIIARKPRRDGFNEYVVVDRGEGPPHHRYVSATVNPISIAEDEWFSGHYFRTLEEAMRHFNARGF